MLILSPIAPPFAGRVRRFRLQVEAMGGVTITSPGIMIQTDGPAMNPIPPFHTAGATGSIPVPPTIQNNNLGEFLEPLCGEFGTILASSITQAFG